MFLTIKQNTIPDFLSALGFVAPKGMDMSYILAPETISDTAVETLENNGFQDVTTTPEKDLNIKYLKKDPKKAFSFSAMNRIVEDPEILSPEFPREEYIEPELYKPIEVKNKVRAIQIQENISYEGKSYLLKENFCGLPRNTLIAFKRRSF